MPIAPCVCGVPISMMSYTRPRKKAAVARIHGAITTASQRPAPAASALSDRAWKESAPRSPLVATDSARSGTPAASPIARS
jgi:hypothetical protein